jgi:hypothetical protein
MRRVGDIMKELGFKEEGPESTKRAFIENLVKAAERNSPKPAPSPARIKEAECPTAAEDRGDTGKKEEQLTFDFSKTGPSVDRAG